MDGVAGIGGMGAELGLASTALPTTTPTPSLADDPVLAESGESDGPAQRLQHALFGSGKDSSLAEAMPMPATVINCPLIWPSSLTSCW
ncbi:MAG: hypothetical protein R2857_12850 [Vampirovibrionales bacterium]